jgi:Ca2+-binding EF-hand superfamily protein
LFLAFRAFDQNENGYMEIQEFVKGLLHITKKSLNRILKDQAALIFARYDKDGDGKLNYTEFC